MAASSAVTESRKTQWPARPISTFLTYYTGMHHQTRSFRRTGRVLAAIVVAFAWPRVGDAMDQEMAIKLAREYLSSDDDDGRRELAEQLNRYDRDIEPVLRALGARQYESVKAGYHPEEHFSVPELVSKHPDDLLYFTVPKSYRPDKSTGLIIFMHGGGRTSSRRAPRYFMNFPDEDEEDSSQLGDLFAATGMIAVGPSAPWNEDSAYRWCLEESDEYLADVIRECQTRFHIDPDRVFLIGHSMGGFGAYHHIQRQPDRFAGVIVNAGSWSLAYWPVIRGTPLCIVHGVRDAIRDERWHYTDIEYARWTDKLLSRQKLYHVYFEHEGEHGVSEGKEFIRKYLVAAQTVRRELFPLRVVLASPVGFDDDYCFPVKHNRWLTLDEAVDGTLEYDALLTNGADDFDDWRLRHRKQKSEGASIDAVNRGDNTIQVTTRNVARFTVWLHPRMVDVKKSVRIVVDGKVRFAGSVKPSLATALASYERRHDWGLIYPIKVELTAGR
jgi:predicted esterase